jgi:predicted metal-dependent HD superfamily phosphohydrolase
LLSPRNSTVVAGLDPAIHRQKNDSCEADLAKRMDTRVKPAYDDDMTLISEPLRAELMRAYAAPDRHYHGLRHIEALLRLAQEHAGAIADRNAVEAAIWFHDAVYDTRRRDNEEQSAALAVARLAGTTAHDRVARIAAMIRATADHTMPAFDDPGAAQDCALFLDMDLAILGSPAAEFEAYEEAVRREYDWVPEPQWIAGRRAVLAGFLARPAIYATAPFAKSHEAAARRNLAHALARLGGAADPRPLDRA